MRNSPVFYSKPLFEPSDSGDATQAWEAEIKSRWAEIERGEVKLIPATEVLADIRRWLLSGRQYRRDVGRVCAHLPQVEM